MIPNMYVKEHGYPAFNPFTMAPGMVRPDLMSEGQTLVPSVMEIPPNANIESILQVHRRKMLRRAANRRSAQLSRARKKAHLEELKAENSRLQRLVDVLDSQPELTFCITSAGKVTYISDRMMNFVKINYGPEDNGDEDPTHVSQLFTPESSLELIDSINKLRECAPASTDDLSLLFSAKEVSFFDAFGNKLVGLLRCSKVHRRSALQDLQFSESMEKPAISTAPSSSSQQPPAKKAKTTTSSKMSSLSSHSSSCNSNGLGLSTSDDSQRVEGDNATANNNNNGAVNGSQAGWNLSNFNMLADCALSEEGVSSSLTGSSSADKSEKDKKSMESSGDTASNDGQDISRSESSTSNNAMLYDAEDEFVCVIRTNNHHFAPYRPDVKDVLMFSSAALLSTTSMYAHNHPSISNSNSNSDSNIKSAGGSSPISSHSSNNSSEQASKANTTSASSETASED